MNDILAMLPTFALSLGLTIVIEGSVALVFRMKGRDLVLLVLVNVLTNPAVVYLNMLFGGIFPEAWVFWWQIPLEIAAVVVEGVLYFKLSRSLRSPWMFAVIANVLSYGMGLIITFVL